MPEKSRAVHVHGDHEDIGVISGSQPRRVAASKGGVVATAHYMATEAGAEMLEVGGNAFDAAVAAAFALGVCEPAASGLGGQTMMLLHHAGMKKTIALDGSSRAPNRATTDVLSNDKMLRGYQGTTVPSTPATLDYALKRYGTFDLDRVLKPAIRLAQEGYRVSELQRTLLRRMRKTLQKGPAGEFFLREGSKSYPIGSIFRQPVLAKTLRRLARHGVEDFYTGRIAKLIHEDMVRNDGLIRDDDLAQIPYPIERRPLTCRFNGGRAFTFPPPAAGQTLIEMLNVYQELPPRYQNPDTPRGAVAIAEVMRRAFLDRQDRPFDPNFFPQVSAEMMRKSEYAKLVARQIRRRVRSQGETTHLSVMDKDNNAVALTQSIESVYGSCVATPELGFLYNNYMNAFEYEDISHPYYLRPNAVPWASVAPTIIFRGNKPWLTIGSPGSERITSAILQVLIRLQNYSPFAAVDAPRFHCSLEGKVSLEMARIRSDIPEALSKFGYEIDEREPYSFYLGCVQLVMREREGYIGVADPRRDGSASGPRR